MAQTKQLTHREPKYFKGKLNVGDMMPDIPIKYRLKNQIVETHISKFKGKLVILDFWSTSCSTCIAMFPRMERLQGEFSDKLQVILVNEYETQEEIDKAFTRLGITMPSVPSIVDAKNFIRQFPIKFIPHHVWIDKTGRIIAQAAPFSAYEAKIRKVIAGEHVNFIKNNYQAYTLSGNAPYYQLLNLPSFPPLQSGSFFTAYNYNYQWWESYSEDIRDSTKLTIQNTYINNSILSLYLRAFKEVMSKNYEKTIYSPRGNDGIWFLDHCELLVKDTLRYTNAFVPFNQLTDSVFTNFDFCYQQVTPMKLSDKIRREEMLEDLNHFFGNLYGTIGRSDKKLVPCYVLVRTSTLDKVSTKNDWAAPKFFTEDGVPKVRFITSSVKQALRNIITGSKFAKSFADNSLSPQLFIDDTDFKGDHFEISLPVSSKISSLADLKAAIKKYDLDIVQTVREHEFVEIKEKTN